MPFKCPECGSIDFFTHGIEEVVWAVDENGDTYEDLDIIDSHQKENYPYVCSNCGKKFSSIPPKNHEVEWIASKKRHYMNNNGSICPFCDSHNIEGGPFEADGTTVWQNVICNNCGAEWTDIYRLTNVEISDFDSDLIPPEPKVATEVPDPNEAFKDKEEAEASKIDPPEDIFMDLDNDIPF